MVRLYDNKLVIEIPTKLPIDELCQLKNAITALIGSFDFKEFGHTANTVMPVATNFLKSLDFNESQIKAFTVTEEVEP